MGKDLKSVSLLGSVSDGDHSCCDSMKDIRSSSEEELETVNCGQSILVC